MKQDHKANQKDATAAYKRGKKRLAKQGFNLPKLHVGDFVRIYDPKRKGIKADVKKKILGKVKLTEEDFVKQFKNRGHLGPTAH